MDYEKLLNILFVFIATGALGVIMGLALLKTVDHRLSEVSINIPPIKLGADQIKLQLPDNGYLPYNQNYLEDYHYQTGGNGQLTRLAHDPAQPPNVNGNGVSSPELDEEFDIPSDIPEERNRTLTSKQLESHRVSEYSPVHPEISHREIIHKQPISSKIDDKVYDDPPFSETGVSVNSDTPLHQFDTVRQIYQDKPRPVQYYKDPSEMTGRQLYKFKKYAKIDKMSLRDYVNWLTLYVTDPDELDKWHLTNLEKLKSGQQVRKCDIPVARCAPKSSEDYFEDIRQGNL